MPGFASHGFDAMPSSCPLRFFGLLLALLILLQFPSSIRAEPIPLNQWVTIGEHGCWGLPEAVQDPSDPASVFITWQRYREGAEECVMDVKYSIFDSRNRSFSPESFLFEPGNVRVLQAHPCMAFWRGAFRLFYCECQKDDPRGRVVEIDAARWADFEKHHVSATEKAITPELNFHPHIQFLADEKNSAWLFYTAGNCEEKIYYTRPGPNGEWTSKPSPLPTSSLVGEEATTLGSAFLEGDDVVLYGSTYDLQKDRQTDRHGVAWRFRGHGSEPIWSGEKIAVSGIDEPFQKEGELFVRVIRMNGKYYLSTQSNRSHRYLAQSDDGVHFTVIRDFGERPALGNTMLALESARTILLIYADASGGAQLGGKVECLLAPVGE